MDPNEDLGAAVTAAQAGDLDAFTGLVRRFERIAYGLAYAVLGDAHAAEDAAQEAFFDAFRSLAQLRQPEAFPGWLRRIVLKHCDRSARARRETAALDAAHAAGTAEPWERLDARERQAQVAAALQALPPEQRAVAVLYYLEERSQQNVARFLDVPVHQVNNRLAAARRALRTSCRALADEWIKEGVKMPDEIAARVSFFLGLAEGLEKGQSVYQTLKKLEPGMAAPKLKAAAAAMAQDLLNGERLSAALRKHPALFAPTVVWIIETGEHLKVLDIATRIALEWIKTGGAEPPAAPAAG